MTNNKVTIAYFGASAFKITTNNGKNILIDPYLTENPLCQTKLDHFNNTDLILVTHGAIDHIGDTVEIMNQSKAVLICGNEVSRYCQQMGIPKERIRTTLYGDHKEHENIKIKTVDARHVSRVETETQTMYGMPMGFVITTENGI